jgi:hypothetical protein
MLCLPRLPSQLQPVRSPLLMIIGRGRVYAQRKVF